MQLRPEQRVVVDKAKEILLNLRLVYLACWMRTGKSLMGLSVLYELGYKNICILTKKNAVANIKDDIKESGYVINAFVTNHEQAKKLTNIYDAYIVDEANEAAGTFPIPSLRCQAIKKLVGDKPLILMSGTPSPEGYSQIYHQFWLSNYSPFKEWKTFYKWAKVFCKQYEYDAEDKDGNPIKKTRVKIRMINGIESNDYSEAIKEKVDQFIDPYMVHLSQEEAGFKTFVQEKVMTIPINPDIYRLMEILKRDQLYRMKSGDIILADTPSKMQGVFHQLSSGTIKIGKKHIVLDKSKATFIKHKFEGKKIAIFYKYISEGIALRETFPNNTSNDVEFNNSNDLVYLCQIRSGRSGTNVSTADCLIMYNIDFSSTSYWQGRERMGSKDRTKPALLYWAFSERGFEHNVYKRVVKKKSYTVSHFKRDIKTWRQSQSYKQESFLT
jgi:hypothetical protein